MKGSIGRETSTIIHMKRPERIKCDCSKCRHGKKAAGTIYCSYYDIFSSKRTSCVRYWGPKPKTNSNRKKKHKNNNSTLQKKK